MVKKQKPPKNNGSKGLKKKEKGHLFSVICYTYIVLSLMLFDHYLELYMFGPLVLILVFIWFHHSYTRRII